MQAKAFKYGDDINTDYIISGKYKFKSADMEAMAVHAMEDLDPEYNAKVKANGGFLVAGKNFGMGSSREQAPLVLIYSNTHAVIAKSFARIFYRNAINTGLPVVECDTDLIDDGDELDVDLRAGVCQEPHQGYGDTIRPAAAGHGAAACRRRSRGALQEARWIQPRGVGTDESGTSGHRRREARRHQGRHRGARDGQQEGPRKGRRHALASRIGHSGSWQHASCTPSRSSNPRSLKDYPDALADALERPEAQTRWEILGALEKIVDTDARVVDRALDGTTAALHDEDSGVVRLAAFRLLATYGATTETRSEKVWPLLDEAIRVYHGDSEFPQMLTGLIKLVSGNASDDVREAAAETMSFDAEHSKGLTGRRAKQVVSCRPKKRRRKKKAAPAETTEEKKS